MQRLFSDTVALLMLGLLLGIQPAHAGDVMQREILQRMDLTGKPGLEVIVSRVTAAPGAKVPAHTHPGDEFLYVISGGVVQVPGRPPITFKDGQTAHFPRGKVHGGFEVIGTKTIVGITTHIVDKGVPMTVLVRK